MRGDNLRAAVRSGSSGIFLSVLALCVLAPASVEAVIKAELPLQDVVKEAKFIDHVEVTRIDREKKRVVLEVRTDLKGKLPFRKLNVTLATGKKDDPDKMLARLGEGLPIVVFSLQERKGFKFVCFTEGTWFSLTSRTATSGDSPAAVCRLGACEIYLRRTYAGSTKDLLALLPDVITGKKKAPPLDKKVKPGLGPVLTSARPAKKPAGDDDSSRWEKTIRGFEAKDREAPPPSNEILFIGSSSIRMWKLDKSFPELKVINRGFGGSQIVDSIRYTSRILVPYKPRAVVLYAGDNDVAAGKSPAVVFEDFKKFVAGVHKELPKARVVFIAIKPSIRRWNLAPEMKKANDLIAAHCERHALLKYVDIVKPMLGEDGKPRAELFIKDGLHLSADGYALWSSLVLPHLSR